MYLVMFNRDDDLYTCMFLCGQCVLKHMMNSEIMLKGLFTYMTSVCLNCENSDQSGHLLSLINILSVHLVNI